MSPKRSDQTGVRTKVEPYPHVRVTFRPVADHGQLQKVAELVLADASQPSIGRAS